MMDTQGLQAFLAVAEQGSFSLAGEQLYLTQPAVSKRIAALESQIGQRLFDRFKRQVVLTPAGHQLLPRARQIIALLKETQRDIASPEGEPEGVVRLATSHHIGLHRLPPILKTFRQAFPRVELKLHFMDSEQAYQEVLEGGVELAIVTLSPAPDPYLYCETIWNDPLHYVCSPEHFLAKDTSPSVERLSQAGALLPQANTFTQRIISEHFALQGLAPRIEMTTNNLDTLKMLTLVGFGFSVLPSTLVDDSLTVLRPPLPAISRKLGYVHHRSRTLSRAADAMIAFLRKARMHIYQE